MPSFHLGGGNGFNAYSGNNHGNRDFTSRRHFGVGNFSSYDTSFEHTPYDDYRDYGRELKLFLELYASYVTLVGNVMSSFDEKSLNGLTSFCESFIKELSTIASSLIVVTKMITRFTWEACSSHFEFAHKSTILYSSFEVVYGVNLLMSFDLLPLSIDYALRFGKMKNMEYFKYIHIRNHDAIAIFHKMFGIKRLVFYPDGWDWSYFRNNHSPSHPMIKLDGRGKAPLHILECFSLGPMTRDQRKKLKLHEDNNMLAYMEDALKSKIEEFDATLPPMASLPLASPVGFCQHHLGGKTPTADSRFYPAITGFLLEYLNLKSSIEVLQEKEREKIFFSNQLGDSGFSPRDKSGFKHQVSSAVAGERFHILPINPPLVMAERIMVDYAQLSIFGA
ncbi:hypothetical protein M9H77_17315 [Catharanthus roseus]|uniref:Uncharacterized protein n=1 Tax=Catharanthus roseus TaxID=4058 RepID=A0ACC0B4H5_CATRO|nr:hypothetical protein M9H77_17315 [Catharanthus roseus]